MKKLFFFIYLFLLIIPSFVFAVNPPEINCPNAALLDLDTGRILYNKNMYDKANPASTTKIMTAIITLENCNLDEVIQASYNAVNSLPNDSSIVDIKVGEEFKVSDLLLGMLVASGNDAANVIAEHIESKTGRYFSDLMNEKAKQIGCVNTNFTNPSGVHNADHYSCAYDLALMYRYAWNNYDVFKHDVSTLTFRMPVTEKHPEDDRVFTNTNKLIIPATGSPNYFYEYTTGGKTGYTSQAKNCLVSSATKGDFNLVCCVLGGLQSESGISYRFTDTKELFDYAFADLVKVTLATKGTTAQNMQVAYANDDDNQVGLIYAESLVTTLNLADSLNTYVPYVSLISGDQLEAPITKGQKLATASFTVYNKDYSIDLLADRDIARKPAITAIIKEIAFKILNGIIKVFVVLTILVLVIRFYNLVIRKNIRKAKKRKLRYNARFRR